MVSAQQWLVTAHIDYPGAIIHITPTPDQFEHRLERDGECWCAPWQELVDGGVIIHHPNLTERTSRN